MDARPPARRVGRPRNASVDAAILRAATELMKERGPAGITINGVARRAGVARASIYLRYPGRDALVTAAIGAARGREPIPATGDLVHDIQRAAEQGVAVMASKAFQAVLPKLVEGLLMPRGQPGAITYAMIAPSRELLVEEYRELAGAAGLRTDLDPNLVADMLVGGLLNRLLVTGAGPSRVDAEQIVSALLEGLRVR